ncbi:hypothetical protein Aperf_G00000032903 [Anoplocephala perfoliata]
MNEYPDPNAPGRPVTKPSGDNNAPSDSSCACNSGHTADATEQPALPMPNSFRDFTESPENGFSWGIEGSSSSHFEHASGRSGDIHFPSKSVWEGFPSATESRSLTAFWGSANANVSNVGSVDKDLPCDAFLRRAPQVPSCLNCSYAGILPMSPGNKDAGELSQQVTNFVLGDQNKPDAPSPSAEAVSSKFMPSQLRSYPPLMDVPLSSYSLPPQQEPPNSSFAPLIQNGDSNQLPPVESGAASSFNIYNHFAHPGQVDNTPLQMGAYPQGAPIPVDLEPAQFSGMRMGAREQPIATFLPPNTSSQMDSYAGNDCTSVRGPNNFVNKLNSGAFAYDHLHSVPTSTQMNSVPGLYPSHSSATDATSGYICPPQSQGAASLSAVLPSIPFDNRGSQVAAQQSLAVPSVNTVSAENAQAAGGAPSQDPYAIAAAVNGAQSTCFAYVNQPSNQMYHLQPNLMTPAPESVHPTPTFEQASQTQSGLLYSQGHFGAERLKNMAALSNGGLNVIPNLPLGSAGSPFIEQLPQQFQVRPLQHPHFISPMPVSQQPQTRSQVAEHHLPLTPNFCYETHVGPAPHYVASPSPLNPMLPSVPFHNPNAECYPLESVTPEAAQAFSTALSSIGFPHQRFAQQPLQSQRRGRFIRPPMMENQAAYVPFQPPAASAKGSVRGSLHLAVNQPRPIYYRNQPMNLVAHNGVTRMPLVSQPVPAAQAFPPMVPQSQAPLHSVSAQMMVMDRGRPLDDYKYSRIDQMPLQSLFGSIVKYAKDQTGSRLIQMRLEKATVSEKNSVFNEILPSCHELITDVFGNYVIQKFLDLGTPEQKRTLMRQMKDRIRALSLHVYGCRVIQKAIETFDEETELSIMRELESSVLECVKDQNGNHVVQKCIERVNPRHLQFIVDAYKGNVLALSTHSYGCRVIQRILEYCTPEQVQPIFEELYQCANSLFEDQYGNYVIQHILVRGSREQKSRIIGLLRGRVVTLSVHKFASNVVEKAVSNGTTQERYDLINEVLVDNDHSSSTNPINAESSADGSASKDDTSVLWTMMKDQFANYVIQKMLEEADSKLRKELMARIHPYINSLRKYNYGKHIINKMEKYASRNSGDVENASLFASAASNSDILTSDEDEPGKEASVSEEGHLESSVSPNE